MNTNTKTQSTEKNKVSIIIPVYNNEQDILTAITSVLNQTYKNWECIVVDDCSTDGTFDLVNDFISKNKYTNEYTNEYTNIVLLHNKINYGTYISINTGINASSGEYICCLGSDDVIIPEYFETNVKFLDRHNKYVATMSMSSRADIVKYGDATLFYRKKIIDNIGYYDSVRFGADSEFIARLKKYSKKIHNIPQVMYFAKKRENSLTTSKETGDRSIRKSYVRAYVSWHHNNKDLYMPFPLVKRKFDIDQIMIPSNFENQ